MTREEQIRQAALAYSFDTDGGHSGDLNAGRDDFTEGAKWADEHPVKFWHKVADGDLPTSYDECLFANKNGNVDIGYMLDNEAIVSNNNIAICIKDVAYWAEIPKLPLNLHRT